MHVDPLRADHGAHYNHPRVTAERPILTCDDRLVIGWREYVTLPEWSIPPLKAKADTGARTSAIDVADIEEIDDRRVRFHIIADRDRDHRVEIVAPIARRTIVRSSLGRTHDRLVVRARMRLGPVECPIELGLVCRANMLCRMLLGRRALADHFLVDSRSTYRLGRPRRARAEG